MRAPAPSELLPPKEIKRLWNDGKLLEEWTREKVLAEHPLPPKDDPGFDALMAELERREHPDPAIRRAVADHDNRRLQELIKAYPERASYALSLVQRKHKRGREKGDARPNDISAETWFAVADTIEYIGHIRGIWWRYLGKPNRSDKNPPTAIKIAAELFGLTEKQFLNLRKNSWRLWRR